MHLVQLASFLNALLSIGLIVFGCIHLRNTLRRASQEEPPHV